MRLFYIKIYWAHIWAEHVCLHTRKRAGLELDQFSFLKRPGPPRLHGPCWNHPELQRQLHFLARDLQIHHHLTTSWCSRGSELFRPSFVIWMLLVLPANLTLTGSRSTRTRWHIEPGGGCDGVVLDDLVSVGGPTGGGGRLDSTS